MSTTSALQPNEAKIYPLMGINAVHMKHGGCWRLWVLCKQVDEAGSGSVDIHDLKSAAVELHINPRCYRLWLADALELGLFVEGAGRYWMAGAAAAAKLLGCPEIGRPASVPLKALFKKGWRSVLWAGYLVTLGTRPVSQRVKRDITRVGVRTQRRYQKALPIKRIKNISEVDAPRSAFAGLLEFDSRTIYESGGKLYQRLPDTIVVSDSAKTLPMGRTRKIQKQLGTSCSMGRGKADCCVRLFYETAKGAQSAAKRLRKLDEFPFEVFAHIKNDGGKNSWHSVTV
jgi:hypothetical protein